ncbi:helix-turn-helix domain-containing protein, partial [Salmonella enterica]|uniref:helix-turn-helix domain-containing protein n=2 Tax=Salmonella enterica TaxID=28901 RepID=UPI00211A7127
AFEWVHVQLHQQKGMISLSPPTICNSAVFAEFETNLRRERQMEGIAAAKARGVYRGRKPSIDPAEVYRLYTIEKMGATAIARQLGIGRASVYRALENYEQPA